ncbi:MAG TPA: Holliday junction branch migration protein RuvA [Rhodocyclaceae bacterium]|nr:Holliday junction branch migration protein RuvA [Rhodocyclaceae bacterium]
MIGRITGTLLEKNPPQIVVDTHGVGYEIDVPMSTFYGLPATGEKLSLYTHFAVREDGHFLYGFASEDERAAFRQLLKVSGIGARTALAVLSGLSVGDLARAVALQEAGRLVKIPGIGKKTAERLLLELRDRLGKALPALTTPPAAPGAAAAVTPDARSDILNALLALGYNEREALGAMKNLADEVGVSDGIRLALKQLSKV